MLEKKRIKAIYDSVMRGKDTIIIYYKAFTNCFEVTFQIFDFTANTIQQFNDYSKLVTDAEAKLKETISTPPDVTQLKSYLLECNQDEEVIGLLSEMDKDRNFITVRKYEK